MTADSEARQRLRAVAQAIGGLRPDDVEDDVLRFVLDRCAPAAFRALQRVPLVRPERYLAHLDLRRPAEYEALRSLLLGVRLAAPSAWEHDRARAVWRARTDRERLVRCQCLCAPNGHSPDRCRGFATDGVFVPVPGGRPGGQAPACVPCGSRSWAVSSS
jgi:hypothetical protein